MRVRNYCCYFDHRYVARALAMMESLRRFDDSAIIWSLCLDGLAEQVMRRISEPWQRIVTLDELESGDPALRTARSNRSLIEYYFTLTPSLVCNVLTRVPAGEVVTYVDGDLYFYSHPAPLFKSLESHSVGIIGHRFPDSLAHLDQWGSYNVGWVSFRNDAHGRAIADWWRCRCNEWCYDVLDGDRFADQKYLEQFSSVGDGVVVLDHPGGNVAPWNLGRHKLSLQNGRVIVDGRAELIFFHFEGLRQLGSCLHLAKHISYGAPFTRVIRRMVYRPYVRAVVEARRKLAAVMPEALEVQPLKRRDRDESSVSAVMPRYARNLGRVLLPLLAGHVVISCGRFVW